MNDESRLPEIMSVLGLHPQAFPLYYDAAGAFLDATGAPSGAVGARARIQRELNNFPHLVYGVRLENVYALGDEPTPADVDRFRAAKEFLDGLQEIEITLTQQNVVAQPTVQVNLVGRQGINWHPFASPFPMAGGNQFQLTATRLVGYPTLSDEPILPTLRCTLVTVAFRADMQTTPPHRRER
jgi:hypothetical protein